MEKMIIKGKKEVKNLLVDSLHQTIQALGISKSTKKGDRLVNSSARKLSRLVSKQLKKDRKKVTKAMKKNNKKKEIHVSA
jgi:hypothetical protein